MAVLQSAGPPSSGHQYPASTTSEGGDDPPYPPPPPPSSQQPHHPHHPSAPPPPPPPRLRRNFLPQISILFFLGLIFTYVEYYTFPTMQARSSKHQGTYHVQTQEGGSGSGGGEGTTTSLLSAAGGGEKGAKGGGGGGGGGGSWRASHADQLTCDFPYQRVDPNCPRFVHLPITRGGGLGNKFFTYILGLLLAIDMKATHLYTGNEFRFDDHQDHGSYPWVEDVFQFGYREMNYTKAMEVYRPTVKDIGHQVWENVTRDYTDLCNVVFMADDFVCNYMICYYSETPRVYERTKAIMRCKMMHSTYTPPQLLHYDPDTYNVAWHIRMGDGPEARLQSIHGNDREYYQRVRDELDVVLEGFPVHYHFFAESPGTGNRAPSEFTFLEELFPNSTYHTSMSVRDTMVHMMSSDLLITSGSSFSFVAATMSYKPVVLFDRPKEGFFFGVYMDYDYVRLDNGRIAGQSLSEVRASVMYKYDLFHDHVVPGRAKLPDASTYTDDVTWRNLAKPQEEKAVDGPSSSISEGAVKEGGKGEEGVVQEIRRRRRLSSSSSSPTHSLLGMQDAMGGEEKMRRRREESEMRMEEEGTGEGRVDMKDGKRRRSLVAVGQEEDREWQKALHAAIELLEL